MEAAKVNKITGIVENIEVCDQEWIDQYSDETYMYLPYPEDKPAIIGLSWSPDTGFEQRPAIDDASEVPEEALQ